MLEEWPDFRDGRLWMLREPLKSGAGETIRTSDLLITKHLPAFLGRRPSRRLRNEPGSVHFTAHRCPLWPGARQPPPQITVVWGTDPGHVPPTAATSLVKAESPG